MQTIDEYQELINKATSKAELNRIAYEAYQEDTSPEDKGFVFLKTAIRPSDTVLNLCLKREAYLDYCQRNNIHI